MRRFFAHSLRFRFLDFHQGRILLCLILLLSGHSLRAQDTVKTIDGLRNYTLPDEPIVVWGIYAWFEMGKRVTALDSSQLAQLNFSNAAEALATLTTASVKNYGPGAISVISTRGTAAEHTRIFWKGMPLNSPSLGLVDLSLLPVEAFDNIHLAHGGISSGAGSNAAGGAVFLESGRQRPQRFLCQTGTFAGSFRDQRGYLKLSTNNKHFSSSTLLYGQQAQNNFPFQNRALPGDSLVRREHAALKGYGLMHNLSYTKSLKHEFFASLWLQQSQREVPAAITVPVQAATQQDSSLRFVTGAKKYFGANHFSFAALKMGTAWEKIRYADSVTGIDSRSLTKQWFTEANAEFWLPRYFKLSSGGSLSLLQGSSDGYIAPVQEGRHSAFVRVERFKRYRSWYVHLRKDFVNGLTPPLCPGAGFQTFLFPKLKLRGGASMSRLFNLPTLNMRYWSPGGRPDLKPERGWSVDGILNFMVRKYPVEKPSWSINASATTFSILLNDWIQWQPQSGNIWSPVNLKQVWSRGLESNFHYDRAMGKWKFTADLQYALTRSTTLQSGGAAQDLIGKQLIYVPMHNANATFAWMHRNWTAGLTQVFTGSRFTEADNSAALPAYGLTHLFASCELRRPHWQWTLTLRLNNLFNTYYESVNWMPMLGRSLMAGLRLSFTSNNY